MGLLLISAPGKWCSLSAHGASNKRGLGISPLAWQYVLDTSSGEGMQSLSLFSGMLLCISLMWVSLAQTLSEVVDDCLASPLHVWQPHCSLEAFHVEGHAKTSGLRGLCHVATAVL